MILKKILILGAGSCIGDILIANLLKKEKYEITALEINNKKIKKRLKKFKKSINLICADIADEVLMTSLIKDHDVIINLCTVMPPLSDYKEELGEIIDYNCVKSIVKIIKEVNNKCVLIEASTTSLYSDNIEASVNNKINKKTLTPYSLNKYKAEELIEKELDNYIILRLPLILNNIVHESFMFNVKKESVIECITNYDAANCFLNCLEHLKKLNKKTYNVGGGADFRLKYNDILTKVLKYYGVSIKLIFTRMFIEKNYYSPILNDSDELNNIINYRFDTMNNYQKRLKTRNLNRGLGLLLGKFVLIFKKKKR